MDWNGQLEAATLGTARRLSATDTNVTDATVREFLERHACNAAKAALALLDAILQAEKPAAAFVFPTRKTPPAPRGTRTARLAFSYFPKENSPFFSYGSLAMPQSV